MSLKALHIVFILLSIAVCLFFGWWSMGTGLSLGEHYRVIGIVSFVVGASLVGYLFFFLRKIRKGHHTP